MPMATRPRPASQTLSRPPERVSEAGILFRGALSVLPQNVRGTAVFAPVLAQMLTRPGRGEGSAPGFGVRVMGWYGGEEGEGKMDIGLRCGARVRSRVKYCYGCQVRAALFRPGYVRLCDGFPCYSHIVSRHNCYYSEILRNLRELFGD